MITYPSKRLSDAVPGVVQEKMSSKGGIWISCGSLCYSLQFSETAFEVGAFVSYFILLYVNRLCKWGAINIQSADLLICVCTEYELIFQRCVNYVLFKSVTLAAFLELFWGHNRVHCARTDVLSFTCYIVRIKHKHIFTFYAITPHRFDTGT